MPESETTETVQATPANKGIGRPSKYLLHTTEEWKAKIKEYMDDPGIQVLAGERTIYKVKTVEGLAIHLGLHRQTIEDWAEHADEFSTAISDIAQKQKEQLINFGLNGVYNPMITKLGLAANHGMRDAEDKNIKETSDQNITMKWES